jgi:hypothetical protein
MFADQILWPNLLIDIGKSATRGFRRQVDRTGRMDGERHGVIATAASLCCVPGKERLGNNCG